MYLSRRKVANKKLLEKGDATKVFLQLLVKTTKMLTSLCCLLPQ